LRGIADPHLALAGECLGARAGPAGKLLARAARDEIDATAELALQRGEKSGLVELQSCRAFSGGTVNTSE
jgi:hypothetical protein